MKWSLLLLALLAPALIGLHAQVQPDRLAALSQITVGSTPPTCTFGTAGPICANEGTAPTNSSGVASLYADSTAHEWEGCTSGSSTCGIMVRAAGSVVQTSKTATISTSTLCAASAGACNVAGQYRLSFNIWGNGTACSSVTAGKVVFTVTWTDDAGTTHSAIPLPIQFDQKSAAANVTGTFSFNTTLATEGATGDMTISTNGAVIQYAATYTACTTGTGQYNFRATVMRQQ